MQKLLKVLTAEPEEGSRQESENLSKSVTRGGVREIYRLLSPRSMKLKGSLNYRGETASHHLDAAREILIRDQFHALSKFPKKVKTVS